jgi:uncharacterized protein
MRAWILAAAMIVAVQRPGDMTMAQTTDGDVPARNRAIVEEGFRKWREGAGSPFDLLAETATWTIAGRSAASQTYVGREAFLREVIRPFNARMREPLQPTIRRLYSDGDTVIVLFDAAGVARDGKPYVNTYAWFLAMRDGRIVEATAFFDSLEFNELWTRVTPLSTK